MKDEDLIGRKFGKLLVIGKSQSVSSTGKPLYKCVCDCGNGYYASDRYLQECRLPSCGCTPLPQLIPGFKAGHLTIIKRIPYAGLLCYCDACGRSSIISADRLRKKYVNPHSPHCGCLSGEFTQQERNMWYGIKDRCYNQHNKRYNRYGARGIQVYEPWKNSFEEFYLWLKNNIGLRPGPEYTLDRIDNDGNYEPGNIRWATILEQIRNSTVTKLNIDQVKEIKTKYLNWNESDMKFNKEMSELYNCKPGCIMSIIKEESWADVEPFIKK